MFVARYLRGNWLHQFSFHFKIFVHRHRHIIFHFFLFQIKTNYQNVQLSKFYYAFLYFESQLIVHTLYVVNNK